MKKEAAAVRNKMIVVRMNETEHKAFTAIQKKTTEKYASNYIRKLLLQQPVILLHRNQSADDFLKEIALLRKELNAIGNNFNQAVKKLHMLDKIPEFRQWLQQTVGLQQSLQQKTEEIKMHMARSYEQWLQK
ncbi:MAG TPA: hypothetical protein VG738_18600 [Chitinophagaceae bacterium]|nr:hypothetical protein [Chitinophagaceae bacterium]